MIKTSCTLQLRMNGKPSSTELFFLFSCKGGVKHSYRMGLFFDYPDLLWVNKLNTNTVKANHEDEGQIFTMMHGFLLQSCLELP